MFSFIVGENCFLVGLISGAALAFRFVAALIDGGSDDC